MGGGPAAFAGAGGIWAAPSAIDTMLPSISDVDGIELWGPEPGAPGDGAGPIGNVDRYSLETDMITGISVYNFDGSPFIPQTIIALAVSGLHFASFEAPLSEEELAAVDLHALMVFEDPLLGVLGTWDGVDVIHFSIDPIGSFDGGEIFTLPFTTGGIEAIVPEPDTFVLAGLGLIGLSAAGRRRKARSPGAPARR